MGSVIGLLVLIAALLALAIFLILGRLDAIHAALMTGLHDHDGPHLSNIKDGMEGIFDAARDGATAAEKLRKRVAPDEDDLDDLQRP